MTLYQRKGSLAVMSAHERNLYKGDDDNVSSGPSRKQSFAAMMAAPRKNSLAAIKAAFTRKSSLAVMAAHERNLYKGEDEMDDMELEKAANGDKSRQQSLEHSSIFFINPAGNVCRLPIPSTSPDDPLNWSRARRVFILAILTLYGAVAMFLVDLPGTLIPAFTSEFKANDIKPFTVITLDWALTLALGISFFFWIPLSVGFGRRPALVMSALMLAAATVGAGFARNYAQLLVSLALVGFAAGASISTVVLQLVDLAFIHERPLAISFYWAFSSAIPYIFLALLPRVVDITTKSRIIFKATSIPAGIIALAIFFFVPETALDRPATAFDGRVLVTSFLERSKLYDEDSEPPAPPTTSTMQISKASRRRWAVLRVFSRRITDPRAGFSCFLHIFLCLAKPLVLLVTIVNAANFGGMASIGAGFPGVLAIAPYNFDPRAIGLVNVAAFGASLAALPASYLMLHTLVKALTRRSGGVRHAEYYLPAFILPIATGAASVFVFGVAAAHGLHPAFYHVAWGLNAFSFATSSIVNTVWVAESLPEYAAPAVAVVGGISFIASQGITAVMPMWVDFWGVEAVNVFLGAVILLVGGLAVPVAFWGKKFRENGAGQWDAHDGAASSKPQARPGQKEVV